MRLDAEKLRALAQIAGADEIEVPDHWTGATMDVEMPPVLVTRYQRTADGGTTSRNRLFTSDSRFGIHVVPSSNCTLETKPRIELAVMLAVTMLMLVLSVARLRWTRRRAIAR